MAIGMTYDQYWHGDVRMVNSFLEAEKIRRKRLNAQAHLQGLYFYEALCDVSPILHAFPKKGTKPIPYSTEPYSLETKEETKEEQIDDKEEAERLQAEVYMRQMMRAGKSWGNGGK